MLIYIWSTILQPFGSRAFRMDKLMNYEFLKCCLNVVAILVFTYNLTTTPPPQKKEKDKENNK